MVGQGKDFICGVQNISTFRLVSHRGKMGCQWGKQGIIMVDLLALLCSLWRAINEKMHTKNEATAKTQTIKLIAYRYVPSGGR